MSTSKGDRLKKKLDKKVITKLGADTILYRFNIGTSDNPHYPETDATVALNKYGEPIDESGEIIEEFNSRYAAHSIRITVDEIKLDESLTSTGSRPDKLREKITGFISSTFDLQIGDKIAWPASGTVLYDVEIIRPNILQGVNVITGFDAFRDVRVND